MDNTDKFTQKAAAYSQGRPSYANAFIDTLYAEQGFNNQSHIADIGSGTGIFTKQLLDRGSTVYAVEPNNDMRQSAERALKTFANFVSVNGTAEHTTLNDGSVDFVTVAQAFHWFEINSFKKECSRILRLNGKVFLIWNTRVVAAEINTEQEKIFKIYCPHFGGFSGGVKQNDERINRFFNGNFKREEFDNPLIYNKEKFIQRSLSSSYSLNENDINYNEYLQSLNDLFDKYSVNGILKIPNITEVYFGTV